MDTDVFAAPRWSTSCFGGTQPSDAEVAGLGEHLRRCRPRHAHLYVLQCGAAALHGFAASRFVTTLAVAATVIASCVLAL